ncbi:MAG: NADPH-ferredoxin reductase FprA [Alphaproteobacteria bacterium MarineAlpha2_Bin1]|nr:MAG: NADPH-ferredoxin reductase FprA [Alphaproteobacteria bacterium MarineAlpha2_Bin1]
MSISKISVVVVGAGPAGFYAADALIKKKLNCEIDIIDFLPTPYGLIRAGVAPDHQTTKKVIKSFEKTALNDSCHFFGNVHIGNEISISELKEIYDAIIIATGAESDSLLDIPGSSLPGVIGSASFVGWYNAHPNYINLNPNLETNNVIIIGNGNVAIDIARVLVKNRNEMAESDIPEYALSNIENSSIKDVFIFGRRGPIEAKFTNVELREMGELKDAVAIVRPDQLPLEVGSLSDAREQRLKEKNLKTLQEFSKNKITDARKRVHFPFWYKPVKILGTQKVEGIQMEKTFLNNGILESTGEYLEIECGLVIPAIGYRSRPVKGLPFNDTDFVISNDNGRVDMGIYAVGWIKRGPSGVISTNRPDGVLAANHIENDFRDGGSKPGRTALVSMLEKKNIKFVSFEGWKLIDKAEISGAISGAPRKKFEKIDDMLDVVFYK